MPLARLRAALPAAALSLLLLTGCTATDDGVTPASDADTSASVSTMPITSTPVSYTHLTLPTKRIV